MLKDHYVFQEGNFLAKAIYSFFLFFCAEDLIVGLAEIEAVVVARHHNNIIVITIIIV